MYRDCRFLVTSRTYAYQRQDWKLNGFAERELLPFTRGQIERFIDTWYAHMAHDCSATTQADARARAEVLKRATTPAEPARTGRAPAAADPDGPAADQGRRFTAGESREALRAIGRHAAG